MSGGAAFQCRILFEDEVRTAAKALTALRKLPKDVDQVAFTKAVVTAIEVCNVALKGAEEEDVCLLLGRKPDAV